MVYLIVGVFIVLDILSGIIKAYKEKGYDSTIMREGLYHKCGTIICVVLGVLVDYTQTIVDIGVTMPVANAICVYIILMECCSIMENICAINPDIVPDVILSNLGKLNKGE